MNYMNYINVLYEIYIIDVYINRVCDEESKREHVILMKKIT